jgi:hypothetical protein
MASSYTRALRSLAARYGFAVRTGGKHLHLRRDGHPLVVAAKSASCHRALLNIERDLRKASKEHH